MFRYELSIAMADDNLSINDPSIANLLKQAITLTNQSKNSKIKGRMFELSPDPIDETHARIMLKSNTEVIPTRAISSLSRTLIAIDEDNIISSYRGCIFQSVLLENQSEKAKNISDVELAQTLISMIFGQAQIKSNKEKELAKEYIKKIRSIVTEYLSKKML